MAAKLYSVKNWETHYEKAQTRKVGKAQWVPIPVKHDGKGFRRLMAMKDGAAIYGAWILILQVAAKCPARGVLKDEDGPLSPEDLMLKTGCSEAMFERAFEVLSSQRIGWMLVSDWEQADKLVELQDSTEHNNTGQDRTEQDSGFEEPQPPGKPADARTADIRSVFEHYRTYHPKAHPSPGSKSKAWIRIRDRMGEGYSPESLARAIDGCHLSPFHCGSNETGTKYHALELIMRDSDQVAKFIDLADNPPRPLLAPKTQRTLDAAEEFLSERLGHGS